ncbi:MAG: hypothetical protein JKY65_20690 [Planctomycetes bacterium]|nr:hypothetical protein [Planctomycetota bacterium]
MTVPLLNDDFRDLLAALVAADASFLIVGAHALAAHGVVRATGDLDVLVQPTAENAQRVVVALRAFGAPLAAHGVSEEDFGVPGMVYQIGLPPRRIDLLTEISGVSFEDAWAGRLEVRVSDLLLNTLGRDALIRNKLAAGRPKDLLDVEMLEQASEP